jgi:hypothetical protein
METRPQLSIDRKSASALADPSKDMSKVSNIREDEQSDDGGEGV